MKLYYTLYGCAVHGPSWRCGEGGGGGKVYFCAFSSLRFFSSFHFFSFFFACLRNVKIGPGEQSIIIRVRCEEEPRCTTDVPLMRSSTLFCHVHAPHTDRETRHTNQNVHSRHSDAFGVSGYWLQEIKCN